MTLELNFLKIFFDLQDKLIQYASLSVSRELIMVLDGDLYLVPFSVLKAQSSNDYLCERFSLITTPSLTSLRTGQKSRSRRHQQQAMAAASVGDSLGSLEQPTSALVIGNPKMTTPVTEQWGWGDAPYAEQEAGMVAEMLQTPSYLCGVQATKDAVLRHISQVECIHFATHVSWKLSAIVLAPSDLVDADGTSTTGSSIRDGKRTLHSVQEGIASFDDDVKSVASGVAPSVNVDLPALSEFLLTAADILNLKLSARLVVVSSVHTRDHHGVAHSDGVVGLTRALLAAGAQCVLVSLWPVPDTAVKIFMRTFYSSLLQVTNQSIFISKEPTNVRIG